MAHATEAISPDAAVESVMQVLKEAEKHDYIGEPVSQLQVRKKTLPIMRHDVDLLTLDSPCAARGQVAAARTRSGESCRPGRR